MALKIDLACGRDKKKGFIGIDIKDYGQKYIGDIRDRLPFESNSAERIEAFHIFEHLCWEELQRVIYECHRVLIKGGILHVQVPDGQDVTQFRPYHTTLWSLNSFDFIRDEWGYFHEAFELHQKFAGKYGHLNFKLKKR